MWFFLPDLIGQGLVQSLAHPGGNITGVAVDTGPAVWGKRIALLREMVPSMTKLAFLGLSQTAALLRPVDVPAVEAAAAAQGVALVVVPVVFPAAEADFRAAIESALRQGADSLMVDQNPSNELLRASACRATARLPAIYPFRNNVEAGGLMAYSDRHPRTLQAGHRARSRRSSTARALRTFQSSSPRASSSRSTSKRRTRSASTRRKPCSPPPRT